MPKNNVADDKPKLTDVEVLSQAQKTLEQNFAFETEGYFFTTEMLYQMLIAVGVNKGTITSVCSGMKHAPDEETVRLYINEQIRVEDLSDLERRFNAALASHWPKDLRRCGALDVAIDFHDRCYYGKAEQKEALWVRGEAKDGTTRFYRVATAYVIRRGQRFTLGIRFVLPEDQPVEVVADLWRGLRWRGLQIGCLFLDKGFAGGKVCEYLRQHRQSALIACPIRGTTGGTRALCQGRAGYRTEYTFNKGKDEAFTADVAMCRVFTTARRTKRRKREATWLLFIVINLPWTPEKCRQQYRKRFGIETSYRLVNKMLGWTTSQNAAYRFFLMALGFVLLNLWVRLCWQFTQVPRHGRRYLKTDLFRQERFISFLKSALEHIYGRVVEITALAVPL